MYDTFHIFLPNVKADCSLLADKRSIAYDRTGTTRQVGFLENMRVSTAVDGTRIKGSLATLIYGHNIHPVSRQDAGLALERLSDSLNLDVCKGVLKRVDIAATLVVRHRPAMYFPLLVGHLRIKRQLAELETKIAGAAECATNEQPGSMTNYRDAKADYHGRHARPSDGQWWTSERCKTAA